MHAVSVLEHFSDHDSIHQKLKKNTASVRSYPNSAGDGKTPYEEGLVFFHLKLLQGLRYIVQPCLLFTTPAFFVTLSPLSRSDLFLLRRCQILFSISSLVRPVARCRQLFLTMLFVKEEANTTVLSSVSKRTVSPHTWAGHGRLLHL
ncbi:hypothetical protein TNCV_169781 [Trichonephila clavipes]|nr:hypothetical protein TNCV_169781 [Trichonephila clavipes]